MGFNGLRSAYIHVTPTIVAQAYSAGQQIGGVNKIPAAISSTGGSATIMSISLTDSANQKAPIDLVFFNASPTLVSTNGQSFNISNSELALKYLCRIPLQVYRQNLGSSNADLSLSALWQKIKTVANSLDLYFVMVSQGNPTYVSTSDLTLGFGIDQE